MREGNKRKERFVWMQEEGEEKSERMKERESGRLMLSAQILRRRGRECNGCSPLYKALGHVGRGREERTLYR